MTREEDIFNKSLYDRSFDQMRRLSGRLPSTSFESLAREVIERVANHGDRADPDYVPTDSEIETLARLLISKDENASSKFVSGLRSSGVPIEQVYLGYLAKAARKLGVWWEEDVASLMDVTLGSGRIYAILRALTAALPNAAVSVRRTAVFAAVPGETHTLGVRMATDLLRRDGWDIHLKINTDHDGLIADISTRKPAIVGLSAAGVHAVPALAKLVVALRISVPKTLILVGGNIVAEASETISLLEVDAMPNSYDSAQTEIERLWGLVQDRI